MDNIDENSINSKNSTASLITSIGGILMFLCLFIPATVTYFTLTRPYLDVDIYFWIFGLVIAVVEHHPGNDFTLMFFLPDIVGISLTLVIIFSVIKINKTASMIMDGDIEGKKAGNRNLLFGIITLAC